MKRLKALCNRHREQYLTFWRMKQELDRFGLSLPEFEQRYNYYDRLYHIASNTYLTREHEPRRLAAEAAGRAFEKRHFVHYWFYRFLKRFGIIQKAILRNT